MLPSLIDNFISATYFGVLHTANEPLSSGFQTVYDGRGNASPLKLSTTGVQVGNLIIPLSAGSAGEVLGVVDDNIGFVTMFPVGAVYFTATNSNPSTFLGGTWINIAQGKFIGGVGTGTDVNGVTQALSAGDGNGEYKHTLTVAEMPAHKHEGYNVSDGPSGKDMGEEGVEWNSSIIGNSHTVHENAGHTSKFIAEGTSRSRRLDGQPMLDNTGGGMAHNNTPPTFGLYVWQRTA